MSLSLQSTPSSPQLSPPSRSRSLSRPSTTPLPTRGLRSSTTSRDLSPISISDDSDTVARFASKQKQKRTHSQYRKASTNIKTEEESGNFIEISSGSEGERDKKKSRAGGRARTKSKKGDGKVAVTRQLKVDEVVVIKDIPTCWTVPRPEHTIAYVLDLSSDTRDWRDNEGKLLSMAAIIKSQVWLKLTFRHENIS